MTIDYDRLQEQLEDFDQAETFHGKFVALEAIRVNAVATARELLRLRDGIAAIRAELVTLAGLSATSGHYAPANHVREYTEALDNLLTGETE